MRATISSTAAIAGASATSSTSGVSAGQEAVGPLGEELALALGSRVRRHEHGARAVGTRAKQPQELGSVASRHPQIEEGDVERLVIEQRLGPHAVFGHANVPIPLERFAKQLAHGRLVVGDENPRAAHCRDSRRHALLRGKTARA
jgi:hypothetical protein